MLPKELIAVEILENIIPDQPVIAACQKLKQDGYCLVLDDFVFKPEFMPFIELADIIKVDFRLTPPQEKKALLERCKNYPIKFLAEKVETHVDFHSALQMGYSYFQGYFFCKPVVLSSKDIPSYKINYLNILREINQPQLEFAQLESIIKRDVSLSYNLLKFINSAFFGLSNKVQSLRQALTLLGQNELSKWASLMALKGLGSHKPGELILNSLVRARFAENLAGINLSKQQASNAFWLGMLSHLDALLDRPLPEILKEIALDGEIKDALLDTRANRLGVIYKLMLAYERGEWKVFSRLSRAMDIQEYQVSHSYQKALVWSHEFLRYREKQA